MKHKRIVITITVMLMFVLVGQVFASYSYNLTAPSYGRSVTTNNEPKIGNCTTIYLRVDAVGGSYTLHAVPEEVDNDDVSTSQIVNDGSRINYLDNTTPCNAGVYRHIRFTTNWNTPVGVQVYGAWNPN